MLVLPPPEALDSRPIYHITVEMNCLRPASYITVVRRGGSERGSYVGEFECQLAKHVNFLVLFGF